MSRRPTVVGLGEVLWDVFPDGPRFGGAPANFASNLAALGRGEIDVTMVSGVGRDDLGRRAVESLRAHGVDTSGIALVDRPTGQVFVELDTAGEATFEIAADTAWDVIAWSDGLAQLAARADAVCFGTLGQRSETSRRTIQRFIAATPPGCLRILDVNLRPPYWDQAIVVQSLERANVLKLNDSELAVLAGMWGWRGAEIELMKRLVERFSLQWVALTRGARGAVLLSASGDCSDLPSPPTKVVNTVGAGDAYTAALAIGMLRRLPTAAINAWGTRVAAFVCSQPGAAPSLPEHLRS